MLDWMKLKLESRLLGAMDYMVKITGAVYLPALFICMNKILSIPKHFPSMHTISIDVFDCCL